MRNYLLLLSGILAYAAQAQPSSRDVPVDSIMTGPLTLRVWPGSGNHRASLAQLDYDHNRDRHTLLRNENMFFTAQVRSKVYTTFSTHPTARPNRYFNFGPLVPDQLSIDSLASNSWRQVFVCNQSEIDHFRLRFRPGMSALDIPRHILHWPGTANPHLSIAVPGGLVEFRDVNSDGIYDPTTGDYPILKGESHAFQIVNFLKYHRYLWGDTSWPVQVKIEYWTLPRGMDPSISGQVIMQRRTVTNLASVALDSCSLGLWQMPDMGNPNDNAMGYDVHRKLGYIYNRDTLDEDWTMSGHTLPGLGANPPVFGIQVFDTPLAYDRDGIDNDTDGQVDESGEKILCSSFGSFPASFNNQVTDPQLPISARAYLLGDWLNYTHRTYDLLYGFTRIGTNSPRVGVVKPAKFMFADADDPIGYAVGGNTFSPHPLPAWTMPTEFSYGSRGLYSVGPFDLASGESKSVTYAMILGRSNPDGRSLSSLENLKQISDSLLSYQSRLLTTGTSQNQTFSVTITPNPAQTTTRIHSTADLTHHTYRLLNPLGQILQTGPATQPIDLRTLPTGTYQIQITGPLIQKTTLLLKN